MNADALSRNPVSTSTAALSETSPTNIREKESSVKANLLSIPCEVKQNTCANTCDADCSILLSNSSVCSVSTGTGEEISPNGAVNSGSEPTTLSLSPSVDLQ